MQAGCSGSMRAAAVALVTAFAALGAAPSAGALTLSDPGGIPLVSLKPGDRGVTITAQPFNFGSGDVAAFRYHDPNGTPSTGDAGGCQVFGGDIYCAATDVADRLALSTSFGDQNADSSIDVVNASALTTKSIDLQCNTPDTTAQRLTVQGSNETSAGDIIDGCSSQDELHGNNGPDVVNGGPGTDIVDGGAGNGDVIRGGTGNDTMSGAEGANEVLSFDDGRTEGLVGRVFNIGDPTATYPTVPGMETDDLPDGWDVLEGSSHADSIGIASPGTIRGAGGDDHVFGSVGNDVLEGGAGADHLYGNVGSDYLYGFTHYPCPTASIPSQPEDFATDFAHYEDATRTVGINTSIDVIGQSSFFFGEPGEGDVFCGVNGIAGTAFTDTVTTLAVFADIDGRGGDDRLTAVNNNATGITLRGGEGDDDLLGAAQSDHLEGGAGNDAIDGGAGNDTIDGGADSDRRDPEGPDTGQLPGLRGGAGSDTITGGAGGDLIFAGEGDNTVNAGDGDDDVTAGSGGDTLNGDGGDDLLLGGLGSDTISGGEGRDEGSYDDRTVGVRVSLQDAEDGETGADGQVGTNEDDTLSSVEDITGGTGDDELTGDSNANALTGGDGNDRITGGAGVDQLFGDDHDDLLFAGDGTAETVSCGSGSDKATADAADTLLDCEDKTLLTVDADGDGAPAEVDCNDNDSRIKPGAADVPGNGVDEDCAGGDARVDADGDGVFREQDCNDGDAAIKPGALEIPGNAVDENCDTVVAPFPKLDVGINSVFLTFPTYSTVKDISVVRAPVGTTAVVTCKAPKQPKAARRGCAFKTKTLKATRPGQKLSFTKAFKKRRLYPKTVVTVKVTLPGTIGKLNTYTVRKRAATARKIACLEPSGKVVAC